MKMLKIVCIGDSITRGYPYGPEFSWVNLLALKTGIVVVNRGINGDSTGGMLSRFARHVIAEKPSHVIITGGVNDLWMGQQIRNIGHNIDSMIQLSGQNNIHTVLGLSVPLCRNSEIKFISSAEEDILANKIDRYNVWLKDYACKQGITLIDFNSCFYKEPGGRLKNSFFADNIHPGQSGYSAMALKAIEVINGLIK